MKDPCIVFLGPSLPREKALAVLQAEYRPPAMRGDIRRAADAGARIIGLIDGVFFQESAVSHREILEALNQGVRVVGASSMGALRASELDTLGMEGVGEIYRLYREGTLTSDDEVALVFDPTTFIPLSEPLVNVRCTIHRAVEEAVISHDEGKKLLATARSLYFPERTYDEICRKAEGQVEKKKMLEFLDYCRNKPYDLKAEDAVLALEKIREILHDLESLE